MSSVLFIVIGTILNIALKSSGIEMNMWQFWTIVGYLIVSMVLTVFMVKWGQ